MTFEKSFYLNKNDPTNKIITTVTSKLNILYTIFLGRINIGKTIIL